MVLLPILKLFSLFLLDEYSPDILGRLKIQNMLTNVTGRFLPHLSVDCVVFGFHEHQLRVLLLKMPEQEQMVLPGGYIQLDESLENAAHRVLYERTGLNGVFLQQFHTFSSPDRIKRNFPEKTLKNHGLTPEDISWFTGRFVSVGFYALVDYTHVRPAPDVFSDSCNWYDLSGIGILMMDHNNIVNKALETLRLHLNFMPVGLNLLPVKFTIPELQKLYETILGRKLDRRNFQRKISSFNILENLHERKTGVAHKAPGLYRFHPENYDKALREGLRGDW
jgi:hypothetical protein